VWREDTFNAVKATFMEYGAFFTEVTKDIGVDRALEIMITRRGRFFRERASMIQQLVERNELDLNAFAAQAETYWRTNWGFDSTIESTPTSIITTTTKCPFYDGFLEAGVPHRMIEAYCRGKDNAGDTEYKQHLGPHAGVKMRKYRTGPNDNCIEEAILLTSSQARSRRVKRE
jgi:hypothetical protein